MDCSNCIFCESIPASGGPQSGCSANRIETLKKRGKVEYVDGYYHLTQFCNMHRTENWNKDTVEEARQEVMLSFGVVIKDDVSMDTSDLERCVMSFCDAEYSKDKIKIVISTTPERDVARLVNIIHKAQESIANVEFVSHLHDISSLKEKECFQKIVNYNMFGHTTPKSICKPDDLSKIDSIINDELKQISMFKTSSGISYAPSKTVRSLYLNYNDYEMMTSDLERISKEQRMYQDLV